MLDIVMDALMDSVKLLPFLFLTYLFMEALEHRTGSAARERIRSAGKFGPVWGSILGVIPQCGFSAAAASLFAGRVISVGTLLAVFLSTSDEMLPIMLSEAVPLGTILKILAFKALIAMISGLLVDYVYTKVMKKKTGDMEIHMLCEEERCNCSHGILRSALTHTVKIFVYILLISLCLNLALEFVGGETLERFFTGVPVLGEAASALVGLIPNCASSVVITKLYLSHLISAGALFSGLLVNAGVGLLVLFRLNRDRKQNFRMLGVLYGLGVFWGVVIELLGITF